MLKTITADLVDQYLADPDIVERFGLRFIPKEELYEAASHAAFDIGGGVDATRMSIGHILLARLKHGVNFKGMPQGKVA